MPVRPEVREAQRLLAALDAAHAHAVGRLAQAVGRRAEVLADQDRLVAAAQEALEQAVADMANQVSAELAAQLFDLELAEVRRLAKSTLTLDLAARVTTGAGWPDGAAACPPAPVLLLSAEDGWGDTIRPRLEAAGADLGRCLCVAAREVDGETGPFLRPVVLPDDISWVARLVGQSEAAMVVVDVLAAYLSDRVDSHKDQSVRWLLTTLGAAAAHTGAAVVLVRHHNKAPGGSPLYRGGGSIGILGAARAAYAVVRDPDDPDHRLLTTVKSNLAPEAPTWGYCLVDVPSLGVARLEWDAAPDPRSAAELLACAQSSALAEAVEWLHRWRLEHPGPASAAQLLADASDAGISRMTLHRARKKLGLGTTKTAGRWVVDR